MFVTYDPNQAFPQPAQLGRGIVERQTSRDNNGKIVETLVHTPPDGLSSFEVARSNLVHGTDERFYQVVSGPTLEAKTQSEVEAILAPEQAAREREKQNEHKREKLKAILSQEDSTINSVLALRERLEMLEEYLGLRDPRDVDL